MSLLILAWVVIVLLCLAVGGLTAQIREIQAAVIARQFARRSIVVQQLERDDGRRVSEPYIAVFTKQACPSCESAVSEIVTDFASLDTALPIVVVSDEPHLRRSTGSESSSLEWIVNPVASEQFNIPAFPWLIAVAPNGDIVDDGVIASPEDAVTRIRAVFDAQLNQANGALT